MRKLYALAFLSALLTSQSVSADADGKRELYWGDAKHPIEGAVMAEVQERPPEKLKRIIGNDKAVVYAIDLDKDGAKDFILRYVDGSRTCFAKSDLSIVSCEKLGYWGGFRYYWFVNLAGDPLLELVSLEGDEDYSDYWIYHFDRKTWKMATRLSIAPVMYSESKDHTGIYWGSPWDITKLITSRSKNGMRLLCAPSNAYRDQLDEEFKNAVFVAFKGLPTQGDPVGGFSNLEGQLKFMSYGDLRARYKTVENPQEPPIQ